MCGGGQAWPKVLPRKGKAVVPRIHHKTGLPKAMERLAGDLSAVREALARLPETRAGRVARARARLAQGADGDDAIRRETAARVGRVLRRLEDFKG